MATDYTPLVLDMLAAFRADTFEWFGGSFSADRTHDAGTWAWPWEYKHTWTVAASAATRDALLRQGWIEKLPGGSLFLVGAYRMSAKALGLVNERGYSWHTETPCWAKWQEAHRAAEVERAAHPGKRHTV